MPPSRPSPAWGDILLTAIAPVLWGTTYILASEVLPPGRPFMSAMIRVLPAGLLLVLLMRVVPARTEWGRLLVLTALNVGVFQALLFVAAYRLPGGLAAVIGAIQPLLVMALGWLVDRRAPAGVAVAAAVLGVVGMALLLLSPATVWEPLGMAAAALGAACMATGTWLTRRWRLDMPLLALTGWQLLGGGLMLIPLAVWGEAPLPALSSAQVAAYAYLSLAGALLASALWFRGIARLSPVAVSSLGLLSPLVAVGLGWGLLGQAVTGSALLGLLMVLASVLAVQWAMAREA
ncbi:EamA family transporter [Zoogloea sp.]|uniref:EamA family transporter n=1 Tax=Zoogloea sp. TaxID=49181 RepID=UPI0035B3CBB0